MRNTRETPPYGIDIQKEQRLLGGIESYRIGLGWIRVRGRRWGWGVIYLGFGDWGISGGGCCYCGGGRISEWERRSRRETREKGEDDAPTAESDAFASSFLSSWTAPHRPIPPPHESQCTACRSGMIRLYDLALACTNKHKVGSHRRRQRTAQEEIFFFFLFSSFLPLLCLNW